MLSLYFLFVQQLFVMYLYLYLVTSQVVFLLMFYPLGILLSLFILFWIFYMVICSSKIILYYLNFIEYFYDVYCIVDVISYVFPNKPCRVLFSWIYGIVNFYSVYIFVFYIKRLEFYIMWFFIFCIFLY
jgi:hypothetical protein